MSRELEDLRRAARDFTTSPPPGTPWEAVDAARELLAEIAPTDPTPGQRAVLDATGTGNQTH